LDAEAFASTFIVESLDGLVSGSFDLGEILEGAVFSGVSAGLAAGIGLEDILGEIPENSVLNNALISGFGDGNLTGASSAGTAAVPPDRQALRAQVDHRHNQSGHSANGPACLMTPK
jgi:hypothetical protein